VSQGASTGGLHSFLVVWFGQTVSSVGTYMSAFAVALWAFEQTGRATTLTLLIVAGTLAGMAVSLVGGALVDRLNRKLLIVLGDTVAAVVTLAILVLLVRDGLAIWHLYLAQMVRTIFGDIQDLAFSASTTLMVPKRHYGRVGSLSSLTHYGSVITGPALAGALYVVVGLEGVLLADFATYLVGIGTMVLTRIPKPPADSGVRVERLALWKDLTMGFRYILARPPLRALAFVWLLFFLSHDFVNALQVPLVLARTDNDVAVRAGVSVAAGMGGVLAAVAMSAWGGPKGRVRGMLIAFVGAGVSKMAFGLVRTPPLWFSAQFTSSLNFPPMLSGYRVIMMAKVTPGIQGRVFAAESVATSAIGTLAALVAGPLADYVFEPAMYSGGALAALLGPLFGVGPGAGMAVLHTFVSLGMVAVGVGGFFIYQLRHAEELLPDHDAAALPPASQTEPSVQVIT
jgi:DHA3 family macrolide efflux protein-like MFS transporter